MTSEIDKLKHFYIEDYSGTNFTDYRSAYNVSKCRK